MVLSGCQLWSWYCRANGRTKKPVLALPVAWAFFLIKLLMKLRIKAWVGVKVVVVVVSLRIGLWQLS